jgi:hypothetical protein
LIIPVNAGSTERFLRVGHGFAPRCGPSLQATENNSQ